MNDDKESAFEQAGQEKESKLLTEFVLMLWQNMKYWLLSLVIVMRGSTSTAPFIHTLF